MIRYLLSIGKLLLICAAIPVVAENHAEQAGYVATGDVLDGIVVISELKADALPAGEHLFYFAAGRQASGQKMHVPVMVLKGQRPGKKLLLTAAVHGDELNGIQLIHQLFSKLKSEDLSGTVIGVPGVNQSGLQANNRHFISRTGGGRMEDPNRKFPGTQKGGGAASLFVGNLWERLFKNNADIVIDLHTQTRGAAYPLFVFSDFSNPVTHAMAFSLMPDMIKNDPGQKGTLETAFMTVGVPAVTFELGMAGGWQQEIIARAEAGVLNVMRGQGFLAGTVIKPFVAPFVGSSYTNVYVVEGGIAHIHVALKDYVEAGVHVATIVDPLGRELRRYYAPQSGRVLAVATEPLRDAGAMLVRILQ